MTDRPMQFLLPLLIFLPLLMGALSYHKCLRYHKREFRHLAEFYLSLALVTLSSWLLLPMGSAFVVLSMLPWIWTLRTFGLLVEDVSKQELFARFHYLVLGLGGVVSIVFLSFDFNLSMVAYPFSLSVGFIGLTFIFQAYSRGEARRYSYLQHLNLALVLAFFVTRLLFPVLIANPDRAIYPAAIDFYLLIAFCATLYPLYGEIVIERHEHFLEEVLYTRNRQLFSHSGFSEYKILSAGITHEVNNALSVINAKVAILIRGKSPDLEKDLRMIQGASNRIVKSIRGLREFIYPQDVQEVLDLGEVVGNVLELYGQRLSNHSVKVEVRGLTGRLIEGQRIQLEQVFLSLINNSVEVLDGLEERWIRILGKGGAKEVEVTYQDSGPSNAEEVLPLLQDPFFSSQTFQDKDIRLVLAKDIIEKHGGAFRCVLKSEHSTYLLALPLSHSTRSTSSEMQGRIDEIRELH